MKQYEDKFGEQPKEDFRIYNEFIRSGKSGSGKTELSEDQQKQFLASFEKHLSGLESNPDIISVR